MLSETENNKLVLVYPNPNNGTIRIDNLSQENWDSLRIIDINGKQCFEKNILNQNDIQISFELKSGVYFLQLINENELFMQKIIMQ
ncbi:MAG: T9SS type A sorting domain-containing protein [Flavobacteriales bacterium]